MLSEKTIYYFAEKCIYDTFQSCLNVLERELTTEKAFNLNQNTELRGYNNEELHDHEILINCDNITIEIQSLFDAFDVIIESLFITDAQIKSKLELIQIELENEISHKLNRSIQIKYEKNSDIETLFDVIYARSICFITDDHDSYTDTSTSIEYSDYDYSNFDDLISTACDNMSLQCEHLRIADDTYNDYNYLDLYYDFSLDLN